MGESGHGFGASLCPAHGAFEAAGEARYHEVFDILGILGTEAPADIGRDDMDLAGLQPAECGQGVPGLVRELGACPIGEPLRAWVPGGKRSARLDGGCGHPGVGERQLDGDLAAGEGVLPVLGARRDGEHRVGFGLGEHQPVVACGLCSVQQGIERRVVGVHQLGSVDRLGLRLGDDHGVGIAHISHPICRQRRAQHLLVEHGHAGRIGAELEIGRCEHAHDARHVLRLVDVDGRDVCVGHRRSDEHGNQCPLAFDVIDVGAADGEEFGVFLAFHAGAEHAHGQGDPPSTALPGVQTTKRNRAKAPVRDGRRVLSADR